MRLEFHIPPRRFWIALASIVGPIILAFSVYAPEVLRLLVLFVFTLAMFAFLFAVVAYAFQEKAVPLPEPGWIGVEAPVADVLPGELAQGESPEGWKRTANAVTPAGFQGEEVITEREKLRRQLVARRREGSFHLYAAGQDIKFAAQENEEEVDGLTVYVTEYNLKK